MSDENTDTPSDAGSTPPPDPPPPPPPPPPRQKPNIYETELREGDQGDTKRGG